MRILRGLLVTVVALVVLGLGAGGWYYTGEMLPVPVPDPDPTYDVEVVASDPDAGTVTLAATEGDLVELDRLGLWTVDDTLELGEVVASDATTVTRTATVLEGDLPEPGDLAAPSVATFRGDPLEALGFTYEEVVVDGPTGPLPAWDVAPEDDPVDGTYAVLVHGRGADRTDMHRELRAAVEAGLPTLVVSIRNDPGAVGDPDGWGRFGDTEWEDLQAAVDLLVEERGTERLVPVGASQGAAIVLTWLRRGEHTELATGAVLVSPLVRLRGTLELQAAGRDIPGPVIGPLLWSTGLLAGLRSGLDVDALDQTAPDALAAFADLPMLVTHGTADTTVPFDDTVTFAEALPDTVTFQRYEGAEHVREWNVDPDRFDADLAAFLAAHAGAPPG